MYIYIDTDIPALGHGHNEPSDNKQFKIVETFIATEATALKRRKQKQKKLKKRPLYAKLPSKKKKKRQRNFNCAI